MYCKFFRRMASVVCSCTMRMFLISLNLSLSDFLSSSYFTLKFKFSEFTSNSLGFSAKPDSIIWYISMRHSVLKLIWSRTSCSGRTSWPLWAPKRAQDEQVRSLVVTLIRSSGFPWIGHKSTGGGKSSLELLAEKFADVFYSRIFYAAFFVKVAVLVESLCNAVKLPPVAAASGCYGFGYSYFFMYFWAILIIWKFFM